ncbi:MAG: hypothetical protein R6U98_03840 [Pirellulaceae bacterium]
MGGPKNGYASLERRVLSVSVCDGFFGGWYGDGHHTIQWRTAHAYQQDPGPSGSVGRFAAAAKHAEVHGIHPPEIDLVSGGDRPLACLAWSSAPRHLGTSDAGTVS